MWTIAHPIHKPQCDEIHPIFHQMIFDEYVTPADPRRFRQQSLDILRVVQDVHQHTDVERRGRVWNRSSIEEFAVDQTLRPRGKFNAFDTDGRSLLADKTCDGPVAAADIQDQGIRRNLGGQRLREDLNPAVEYRVTVRSPQKREEKRVLGHLLSQLFLAVATDSLRTTHSSMKLYN